MTPPKRINILRLLDVRSEHAYTERLDRAMPDEPEAVSEDEQRAQTRDAGRTQFDRERLVWLAARAQMIEALDALDVPSFVRVQRDLRAIRRTLDRVEKRLAS